MDTQKQKGRQKDGRMTEGGFDAEDEAWEAGSEKRADK